MQDVYQKQSRWLCSKKISSEELSWMAGFFDGEGCIGICHKISKVGEKTSHAFSRRVCVVNTDIKSLEIFQNCFGGNIRERKHFKNYEQFKNSKPIYEWTLHSLKAVGFISRLFPYLKTKKERASLFINFQNSMDSLPGLGAVRGSHSLYPEYLQRSIYMSNKLKQLNKRGIK